MFDVDFFFFFHFCTNSVTIPPLTKHTGADGLGGRTNQFTYESPHRGWSGPDRSAVRLHFFKKCKRYDTFFIAVFKGRVHGRSMVPKTDVWELRQKSHIKVFSD
eukprot:TRINITY_DN10595_c6_g1_i4.p1 TRINITY_DN10595_c6_g1~~TRINITY_DN10595_c6_g1_i4.p1  ORF type:complete len:104 (+),score=7.48 TRINITY_DN10595_c6_g1_i4:75-386(+)